MKKTREYTIRVNCIGFKDITVEASGLQEARMLAQKEFNCGSVEGEAEFEEIEL